MVKVEDIMNTLFKARESQVELFAETLLNATSMDSQQVDGKQMDAVFSFGMLLTKCDKCKEIHWFIAFAEHGTPLNKAVPEGEVIELMPAISFESAVQAFMALNDESPRH